jgi:S1-C subfamily serine protease
MKKYYLVLMVFLSSCVSLEQATEDNVYIGMTKSKFCVAIVNTYISQDPCMGDHNSIEYNSYRNTEILSPSDRSSYFVFKNVDYRMTGRGNGGGVLASIFRDYNSARFAMNNQESTQQQLSKQQREQQREQQEWLDQQERRAKLQREQQKEQEEYEQRIIEEKIAKDNNLIEVSSGTGFFINDQGYFVSNNHVVEICSEVKTKKEGQTYIANIIAVDQRNDLALGKVNFSDNDYISISDVGARLGEEIIVAGFPFQKQLSESIKITKGIISSLSGPGNDYSVFQMDAAVQPGNSGGPIINNQGKLIGVTVAKANSEAFYEETGSLPENINFGIKVEMLEPFLKGNNIRQLRTSSSSRDLKTNIELAKKADGATIHLQCWNTIASLRELVKDNKVRNLLIDID